MKRGVFPLVSIVILNYNGLSLGHLDIVLKSVMKTNYPNFEVIVVDNGSKDDSLKFIKKFYPQVRTIALKKNYGTSIGYMVGVLNSRGKYVAILNNDVEVDPNWLYPLVSHLEKIPWVVAADPKFKSYFQRNRFEDSAAAGRFIDRFGNNYTRGVNEIDRGDYNKPVYIMGVLTFFRRDILLHSGGFDPYFIFGYEDIDLAWRFYLMGYKVLYIPESVIYHKSGGTTREGRKRPKPGFYYLNKRNRLISIFKNHSISNALIALLITSFEYIITLFYFMFKYEKTYSRDLFMAIWRFFKCLKFIAKRRSYVQALRKVNDAVVKKYMVPYSGIFYEIIGKGKN